MSTVYFTKYALGAKGKIETQHGGFVSVEKGYAVNSRTKTRENLGKTAFLDKDEALAAVEAAKEKRLASLRKQIETVEKIKGHF